MKKVKIETVYLVISLIVGILFVFIVPPFQSPDEDSHFVKSYALANGEITPDEKKGNYGFYIPEDMNDYINEQLSHMSDLDIKYTYKDIYFEQLLASSYSNKTFRGNSAATASFFAYVIPALGIKTALTINAFDYSNVSDSKTVGTSVLVQYARLFSLIAYTIIGYFAIKITPKFKKTFFTVMLLPSSIFLRSMVTYDSIILVFAALAVAVMLRLYCDKKHIFNKYDFISLVISGYLLLNIKTVYSIIFLLMLFIPYKRFNTKKNMLKMYIFMVGSALLLTILTKLCFFGVSSETAEIVINQHNWVSANIFSTLGIVIDNIFSQMSTQLYWMTGTLGLLDTYLPVLVLHMIYLNMFVIILYDLFSEKLVLPWYVSISYVALIFISIMAIYLVMYLDWTPVILNEVGGSGITGVQGRYFIPYLLMIPFVFSNKITNLISSKLKNIIEKCKHIFDNYYWVIPVSSLVVTLFIVFIRYY